MWAKGFNMNHFTFFISKVKCYNAGIGIIFECLHFVMKMNYLQEEKNKYIILLPLARTVAGLGP